MSLRDEVTQKYGNLDGIIHSAAYAPRERAKWEISR